MKTSGLLTFILAFSFSSSFAQDFQLKTNKVGSHDVFAYVGSDAASHYYHDKWTYSLYSFDKSNMKEYKIFKYHKKDKKEGPDFSSFADGYFFVGSKFFSRDFYDYSYLLNIYKINPKTGEKVGQLSFGSAGDLKVNYTAYLDTFAHCIKVFRNGDMFSTLNYDLETIPKGQIKQNGGRNYLMEFASMAKYLADVKVYQEKMNSKSEMPFFPNPVFKDEISFKNYGVEHRRQLFSTVFFQQAITSIRVYTRKDTNGVSLELDKDKTIVDLYYLEDRQENLIIIGKYVESKGETNYYGVFSVKYNPELKEISTLEYSHLVDLPKDEKLITNKKNMGFIYSYLADPAYEFQLEGNGFVMTYQKQVENMLDHIYILHIDDEGGLKLSVIYNLSKYRYPLSTGETYVYDEDRQRIFPVSYFRHYAYYRDGKVHFVFFDNEKNLRLLMDQMIEHDCNPGGSASVLVSCIYHPDGDVLGGKARMASGSDFFDQPHLNTAFNYIDGNGSGKSHLYFAGMNKKGKIRCIYELEWTDK